MKRFVTYLYECESGKKTRNVGFIRVNERGEEMTLEVNIRNLSHANGSGRIYLLMYKENLQGIELGEFEIKGGQSDSSFSVQVDDIMQSIFPENNIEGIGIQLDSGIYIASCWKDEHADKIVRGEFEEKTVHIDDVYIEEHVTEVEIEDALAVAEDTCEQECTSVDEWHREEKGAFYEKIDLSQIRNLPSPNWHLATNSFLLHGFWNYGYLVLKKDMEEDKEILSLGVPGIFEKPEAVMAIFFGFPTFDKMPEEMVGETKENQEPKAGTFGCWFTRLKI